MFLPRALSSAVDARNGTSFFILDFCLSLMLMCISFRRPHPRPRPSSTSPSPILNLNLTPCLNLTLPQPAPRLHPPTSPKTALSRLEKVFLTETIDNQILIEPDLKDALEIRDAEFVWYGLEENGKGKKGKKDKNKQEKSEGGKVADGGPTFRLTDISFSVPRGSLVGIVGPVGCGECLFISVFNPPSFQVGR